MEQNKSKSYGSALYTIITVFFFWGFLAASNGIFIPFCKAHFNLTQFESQLIDFTFYGGYFIGSLGLYFASQMTKVDILNKLGYKKMEDWYEVTFNDIKNFGGNILLSYYGKSPSKLIQSVFPSHEWKEWKFPKNIKIEYYNNNSLANYI